MGIKPSARHGLKRAFIGLVEHRCGESGVVRLVCDGVPCPNAKVFNEKGTSVGVIEEVLGRSEESYASFTGAGLKGERLFVDSSRILRHERFLSRTDCALKKEKEDRDLAGKRKSQKGKSRRYK